MRVVNRRKRFTINITQFLMMARVFSEIVGGVVAGAHGVVVAWLVSCNVVAPCALVTGLAGWLAWRLAELTLSLQIQFHQSVQLSSV